MVAVAVDNLVDNDAGCATRNSFPLIGMRIQEQDQFTLFLTDNLATSIVIWRDRRVDQLEGTRID